MIGWGRAGACCSATPKDFTPVCTTELAEASRLKPEFDKRNVKVLGLSVDSTENHGKWAEDIEETQGQKLNFPVQSDPDRKVSTLYGMVHPEADPSVTVRAVYVIGREQEGPPDADLSALDRPEFSPRSCA